MFLFRIPSFNITYSPAGNRYWYGRRPGVERFADQLQREYHHLRRYWQSAELGNRYIQYAVEQRPPPDFFTKADQHDIVFIWWNGLPNEEKYDRHTGWFDRDTAGNLVHETRNNGRTTWSYHYVAGLRTTGGSGIDSTFMLYNIPGKINARTAMPFFDAVAYIEK